MDTLSILQTQPAKLSLLYDCLVGTLAYALSYLLTQSVDLVDQLRLDTQSIHGVELRIAQFDPVQREFRVGTSNPNGPPHPPKLLPRAVEETYFSADLRWLLVAPETHLRDPPVSNTNSTIVPAAIAASRNAETHTALAPPSHNSATNSDAPIIERPVVASLTGEEAEKVMQLAKELKSRSRSRIRRIRVAKSQVL
jgi:hypothetical protein